MPRKAHTDATESVPAAVVVGGASQAAFSAQHYLNWLEDKWKDQMRPTHSTSGETLTAHLTFIKDYVQGGFMTEPLDRTNFLHAAAIHLLNICEGQRVVIDCLGSQRASPGQ